MGRIVPEIDPDLAEKVQSNSVHVKKISTRRHFGHVQLPASLQLIAEHRILEQTDEKFRSDARILHRIMKNFKLPDDSHTLAIKRANIKTQLELRDKIKLRPEYEFDRDKLREDEIFAKSRLAQLIQGTLEQNRRDWHYYEYDERASLLYMAARLAPNYACVKTVMNEIRDLEPTYKPKSVLDFGSGMGTTTFAVNETWPNSVSEFLNVDISKEQQSLCEYLLRGGKHLGDPLPGIFHRQYLPTSNRVKYDLVVAAFSLLELPNFEVRTHTIENLWNKTNDMLVLIERGNRGGFATINEARHFILDMTGHDVTKRINFSLESRLNTALEMPSSHCLSPCPHEYACPRATLTSKNNQDTCCFRVYYDPINIGQSKPGTLLEDFSFVILRKKPHTSYTSEGFSRWPRIVEERKRSRGQITFKMCCPNGNLAETTITKAKYGKASYKVSLACDWGDLLPIKVKDIYYPKNSKLIKDS